MSPVKPAILFIHGAWHGPEAFEDVMTRLKHSGFESVSAVTLPSVGPPVAHLNFDSDVAVVRSAVKEIVDESHQECVVVMHSYGGVVGTEALKGLTRETRRASGLDGGVTHLAYISGSLLTEGQSLASIFKEDEGRASPTFEIDGGFLSVLDAENLFYNDLPPEDAKFWAAKLKPQSPGVFSSPLTYAAWKDIPSSYLICTRDNAISLAKQEEMIANAGLIGYLKRCDSGHSPFLSQPEVVETFIKRAAGN